MGRNTRLHYVLGVMCIYVSLFASSCRCVIEFLKYKSANYLTTSYLDKGFCSSSLASQNKSSCIGNSTFLSYTSENFIHCLSNCYATERALLKKLKWNTVLNAVVDSTSSTEGRLSRKGKNIRTRNEKRRARCTGYCNGCTA